MSVKAALITVIPIAAALACAAAILLGTGSPADTDENTFTFDETSDETFDEDSETEAVSVNVYDFSEHDRMNIVTASGTAVSADSAELTAPSSAAVSNVYVRLGQYVSKGDKICSFDTSEIEAEIAQLETEAEKAEYEEELIHSRNTAALNSAIESGRKQTAEAESRIEQIRSDIDGITFRFGTDEDEDWSVENEEAAAELEALNAELADALSELDAIKEDSAAEIRACQEALEDEELNSSDNGAELAALRAELDASVVTAPMNGMITYLGVKKGSSAESIVCTISDMSNILLKTSVKESAVLNVHTGMNALITADASDQTINGTVSEIIMVPEASEDPAAENTYTVYITPDRSDLNWAVGMKVNTEILIDKRVYMYEVPANYINSDENGDYIFTAEIGPDGSASALKRYISTGKVYPEQGITEIYFDGIDMNTKPVISSDPSTELYDGAEIDLEAEPDSG